MYLAETSYVGYPFNGKTDHREGERQLRMDRQRDRQMDGRMDRETDRRMDGQMDGRTAGQTDSQMDGRTDRQTDGRTDGWTNRQTDRQTVVHACAQVWTEGNKNTELHIKLQFTGF